MNNSEYIILGIIFILFFALWFLLHIKDRRRVLNGLAFFISLGSIALLMMLVGFIEDVRFLIFLSSITLLLPLILAPLAYLVGLYILFSTGVEVIKKEGLSLSHMLSILMGVGIIGSSIVAPILANKIQSKFLKALMFYFLSVFSYFVFGFIIFTTSALIYNLWWEKKNKDYLIVLGAGLNGDKVTPLLRGRIDRAIDFYKEQEVKGVKPPKLIMSGGKGADEIISEAQAMKNYALEVGIPEENIMLEDKSTSTRENLEFSSRLIGKDSKLESPKVLFVTTNYHVFRASLLAKDLNLDYNGIGSKTKLYYFVSAFIREYIAVLYINIKTNLIVANLIGIVNFFRYLTSIK